MFEFASAPTTVLIGRGEKPCFAIAYMLHVYVRAARCTRACVRAEDATWGHVEV